jgi:hypothetical protein
VCDLYLCVCAILNGVRQNGGCVKCVFNLGFDGYDQELLDV